MIFHDTSFLIAIIVSMPVQKDPNDKNSNGSAGGQENKDSGAGQGDTPPVGRMSVMLLLDIGSKEIQKIS
jgi:hypothetical protein